MIKVYFGPYKHSPVDELHGDERRLWLSEFGLLKGVDRDFWTNNHMVLDMFAAAQILMWLDERWIPLSEAADRLLPGRHGDSQLKGMSNGRLALLVELTARFKGLVPGDDKSGRDC